MSEEYPGHEGGRAERSDDTAARRTDGGTAAERTTGYGISRFPDDRHVGADERARIREEYGRLRAYYKTRPEQYHDLQRWLNQARMGTSYDVYLANSARYAVVAATLGVVLGVLLTAVLSNAGVIAQLRNPIPGLRGGLPAYLGRNRGLFTGALVAILLTTVLSLTVWYGRYIYPRSVADARRRNVDVTLPHSITFMYALSYGGMSLLEVVHVLGEADDTYGEVAAEFEMISRDVELFGNDLFTALRNARNLTPSDNLEQFLDDLLSVLDSGGELTVFLEDESEKYMQRARDEQQSFLDALATLSEIFVVAFVAAPLFVVVTMMMLSLLGNVGTIPLAVIVYLVIPLGMTAFLVIISVLSEPYKQPDHQLQLDDREPGDPSEAVRSHPHFGTFRRLRERAWLSDRLADPTAVFREYPPATLLVTVPLALVLLGGIVTTGLADPTPAAFIDAPVSTTALLVIAPFLLVSVPLSLFHELARRRSEAISRRLPDALDILASANQMGVGLVEGLDLVARNLSGRLAVELRRVSNDIRWNNDIRRALLGLADRLQVSQLTRTCKILAEGSRSTGDLHRVLDIAAEDTRHRYRLARDRQQTLSSYTAVVIIGFLVYLAVIVIINESFLGPITGSGLTTGDSGPVTISQGAVDAYRTLFFHSAIIQGVGTGLITGKLSDNQVLTGLKYSIALVLVAFGVFLFL